MPIISVRDMKIIDERKKKKKTKTEKNKADRRYSERVRAN